MGWVDVTLGKLLEYGGRKILTLSTLQAEDRKDLSFKPASWLRGLKKGLVPPMEFGVRGTNVVHGGSDEYRDMGYSPGALQLRRQGVVWKQYPSDNAEFEPLAGGHRATATR
jgi:hypothetical protein